MPRRLAKAFIIPGCGVDDLAGQWHTVSIEHYQHDGTAVCKIGNREAIIPCANYKLFYRVQPKTVKEFADKHYTHLAKLIRQAVHLLPVVNLHIDLNWTEKSLTLMNGLVGISAKPIEIDGPNYVMERVAWVTGLFVEGTFHPSQRAFLNWDAARHIIDLCFRCWCHPHWRIAAQVEPKWEGPHVAMHRDDMDFELLEKIKREHPEFEPAFPGDQGIDIPEQVVVEHQVMMECLQTHLRTTFSNGWCVDCGIDAPGWDAQTKELPSGWKFDEDIAGNIIAMCCSSCQDDRQL